MLAATFALGLFVGGMRMLTGNHFPTDVLFAALLTSLSALALHDALVAQRVPLPPPPRRLRLAAERARLHAAPTAAWLRRLGRRLR